jgi:signal transduction histidine kinase
MRRRDQALGWLRRPGIGRRVALAMALSLVAVQLQAFLQVRLLARPEVRLVGTAWLADTARDAARFAFALPPEARAAALAARAGSPYVRLEWSPGRPWPGPDQSGHVLVKRFAATLRQHFPPGTQLVVAVDRLQYLFPFRTVRVVPVPDDIGARLADAPLPPGADDELMATNIRVAVQGADGSWLSVTPVGFADLGPFGGLPLPPLIAAGLIISLVSIYTARRLMAPLDRLVEVAGRIGTARAFVPVPAAGLGEFGAVARAFEEVQHRLLRFDAERTQMLAAISHDLRSALTRLQLAIEPGSGRDPDPVLAREIADMQAMVDSTLAFAGGEARQATLGPTDVAALLISLVDEASDQGMACSYEGPDHAVADAYPPALRRAFRNLIDNAVKYGGTARVRLAVEPRQLRITILDQGPGIPPHRFEEALAPFRRLDPARSGQIPGVGLGLTIARDVVASHGGSLALGNPPEGGLCVEVTLPRGDGGLAAVGPAAITRVPPPR